MRSVDGILWLVLGDADAHLEGERVVRVRDGQCLREALTGGGDEWFGAIIVEPSQFHPSALIDLARRARRNRTEPLMVTRLDHPASAAIPRSRRDAWRLGAALYREVHHHGHADPLAPAAYVPREVAGALADLVVGPGIALEISARLAAHRPVEVPVHGELCARLTVAAEPLGELIRRSAGREPCAASRVRAGDTAFWVEAMRDGRLLVGAESGMPAPTSVDLPDHDRLRVGLVPDGGRRWARKRGESRLTSYHLAFDSIAHFSDNAATSLDAVFVYALSQTNLARTPEEVGDAVAATREGIRRNRAIGHRPVAYGQLELLGAEEGEHLARSNLESAAQEEGMLVVFCIGYASKWERWLLSEDGRPATYGLTAATLAEIRARSIGLVLRTGGASTLSDFLPDLTAYAQITFSGDLFNDVDVATWFSRERTRLRGLRYGT